MFRRNSVKHFLIILTVYTMVVERLLNYCLIELSKILKNI